MPINSSVVMPIEGQQLPHVRLIGDLKKTDSLLFFSFPLLAWAPCRNDSSYSGGFICLIPVAPAFTFYKGAKFILPV